jgi:selenocysteine lyase/cysteine desulfurase
MPSPVLEAVIGHLQLEAEVGGYEAARVAVAGLGSFYTGIAALIGAAPEEIAYVENATRAWDMAFYGLPLRSGDRVLTHGAAEYSSNYLALLQQARRRGPKIDLVPSDAAGQVDVAAMEAMIGARTRAVLLTHVPTQGGLVNPAEAVGAVARKHGLFYLLDACQSVGQIVVDVRKIGCHALSGTGRKFLRGPRGTGFLYVSNEVMEQIEPPFVDLHAATWTGPESYELAPGARRFENWESFVAGRLGLARAVAYANDIGMAAIEARVAALAGAFRAALAAVPGVELCDTGARQCGIVTFTKTGETAEAVAERLGRAAINVSTSTAANARFDLGARGIDVVVRASVHYFNTEAEVARFCEVLEA